MKTLLRGRILTFHADPAETEDNHRYIEDGAIIVENGVIVGIGNYSELADSALPVIDHRPHLIMPGLIDPHIHFPQVQVIASWGKQLLDCLNGYVFPGETRFADPGYAARMAEIFLDLLLAHGTTTACAFASVHPGSVDALFAASEGRGMRMIAGKVMMDRNAPDGLRDTPQRGYDETKALIERWSGKGRLQYAITPRFAITSTAEQMKAAGTLASEHPDLHIQTHLSENQAEVDTRCRSTLPCGTISTSTRLMGCLAPAVSWATPFIFVRARSPAWPRRGRGRSSARPPISFLARASSTRRVSVRQASCPASRRMSEAARIIRYCRH
jgi:guanine deaminase